MQDENEKESLGSLAEGSLTPAEEQKIEAKVDKMLSPNEPDPEPEPEVIAVKTRAKKGSPPPIDIFADAKTAPEVPTEVLETMVEPNMDDTEAAKPGKVVGIEPAAPEAEALPGQADGGGDGDGSGDGSGGSGGDDDGKVVTEPLDDKATDQAVDDITRHESDEVLAAQDAAVAKAFQPKSPRKGRLKAFFSAWWHSRKARYITLAVVVIVLVILGFLPVTRSFALNVVGVRATAELTVLDNTTQLPLKDVQVSLGGASGTTNSEGDVTLSRVKLGSQQLVIKQVAFATVDRTVQVGMGSNDLGDIALTAVGTQYKFTVVDYVSGKPLSGARADSGASNAEGDSKGTIILTVKDPNGAALSVQVSAQGYNTATVKVAVGNKATTTVQLVPSEREVYVSKQSGTYDVYESYVDGSGKKLLLEGTGLETANELTLLSDATGNEAALISTRDNIRDSGGYLEEALTVINTNTGAATTIDHSDRIQPVSWIGEYLVYVEVRPGASAANPSRYQLMSYNYVTNERLELDHANYFNDIVSAHGAIYYATSNQYSGGVSQFNGIRPNNTGKQTLLTNDVWNIFRTDYNDFALSTATGWYTYEIGAAKPVSTPNAYNGTSRLYIDSPDAKHSAWIDTRDGKGALIIYDQASGKEATLTEQAGLTYPVSWLNNDTLIYRVSTPQETADYVISLNGGTAKKIADVTNAAGITLWYYY
ncbi:MAG TPA: hypothetical protein VF261_00805 [Candidatus Saccharimonadales bacterium]